MLNFLKKFMLPDVEQTIRRFPLPLTCLVIATLISLVIVHNNQHDEFTGKMLILFNLSYFALISQKLLSESKNWRSSVFEISAAAIFIAIACRVFSTDNSYINLMFMTAGIVLTMWAVPFFTVRSNDADSSYNCTLITNMFFAAFSTLILCGGLCAILASIGYLFGVEWGHKLYVDILVISWSFYAPFYTLSGIPKKTDSDKTLDFYPAGLKFIVKYILIPLVTCYLLILYAYMVKIIILWQLPKGNLGYMISGFGVVGVITYLFAYPLRDTGNKLVHYISRYFFHLLLAPLAMLLIAVKTRIGEYGITEERYLLIVIAVWLITCCLYFIMKKAAKLSFIAVTISCMMILASFGPWGAVSISAHSQVARLKLLLIKNEILVNGQVIQKHEMINNEDARNIYSIVNYLSRTKKLVYAASWFNDQSYMIKNYNKDIYVNTEEIMNDLGVKNYNSYSKENSSYFNWNEPERNRTVTNVSGFDYVIGSFYIYSNGAGTNFILNDKNEKLNIVLKDGFLKITDDKTENINIDLRPQVQRIYQQYGSNLPTGVLPVFEGEGDTMKVKIVPSNISGSYKDNNIEINSMNAMIVLKYKN